MVCWTRENIYGHGKRLQWILRQVRKEQIIVELGCGTGYMISLPLAKMNHAIWGLDIDRRSIRFGQELFRREGLDPDRLKLTPLHQLELIPDVIIASEVLEHLETNELSRVLSGVRTKLNLDGLFLVTVPNGFGWFEVESYLWFRIGIGRLLQRVKVAGLIHKLKCLILGSDIDAAYPSTLSESRHLQRFSYSSIQDLLRNAGFEVEQIQGAVLFCGPFSNLFFTGINPIMRLNCLLGQWFPRAAAGFHIRCRVAFDKGITPGNKGRA